jgi:DNA (cytosine-5)-methyltransferase 1
MSLGDAIEDLLDAAGTGSLMDTLPVMSEENIARVQYLFEHELYDLPLEARPDCHKDGTSYNASYGRMFWDKPAPTLTTGFMSPGRGRFVHPLRPRVMTPREGARVQGFPDWYNFEPAGANTKRTDLAKWLGDAVPSILGYVAAKSVLKDF